VVTFAISLAGLVLALLAAGWLFTRTTVARIERDYPPIGRLVTAGPHRLHVVDRPGPAGDRRPPVIVIHGASGNLREPMMALDRALAGERRVLYVDRPGHGWSSRRGRVDASPTAQAAAVHALMQAFAIPQAIIVGISWGGSVAAAFAVEHPEATAGLLFIAPATHPWPGGVDWHYGLTTAPLIGPLFAHAIALPVAWRMVPAAARAVFRPEDAPDRYAETIGAALLLRPAEFIANAEDVAGLKAHVTAYAPRYTTITAPTEIVTGDQDPVVYASIHSEGLKRDIAGARLTYLAGAGHMPHHTRLPAVLAALDRLDAAIAARATPALTRA
jgi:pimeloyl-ACP methyl ester carboxylesterase